MLTTVQIRDMLGLPRNTKPRQVLNRALREWAPGGAALLDTLERLDYARHQLDNHPHFAAEVGKLRSERDRLIAAIRAGHLGPHPPH